MDKANKQEQEIEESVEYDKELIDIIHKEVSIIQDIIKRVASNSFLVKGWAVTLIVITFIVKQKGVEGNKWIPVIPLLSFWYLDSFFLYQERTYRKLYNWVIQNRQRDNISKGLFDMNPYREGLGDGSVWSRFKGIFTCMYSSTLLVFYGTILLLTIILNLV